MTTRHPVTTRRAFLQAAAALAAMGKYLIPGTPLAGERSPDEVRKVAATLK